MIDDTEGIFRVVSRSLEDRFEQFHYASNIREARLQLESNPQIGLVFCDVHLRDETDSNSFVSEIRKDFPTLIIFRLTASLQAFHDLSGSGGPHNAVLLKPFDLEEFRKEVLVFFD